MKKSILLTLICLIGIGMITSSFKVYYKSLEHEISIPYNGKVKLKNPSLLSEDKEFLKIIQLYLNSQFLMARAVKSKSIDVASAKLKVSQMRNKKVNDDKIISAADEIFKQPMSWLFENQHKIYSSLTSLKKKYEPISRKVLKKESIEALKNMQETYYPELPKWLECPQLAQCMEESDLDQFMACYVSGSSSASCAIDIALDWNCMAYNCNVYY